jgi:hypothetical protein
MLATELLLEEEEAALDTTKYAERGPARRQSLSTADNVEHQTTISSQKTKKWKLNFQADDAKLSQLEELQRTKAKSNCRRRTRA